jgi:hypothetical protein
VPNGGLANRMFQHMLALVLHWNIPDSFVTGNAVPEFTNLQTIEGPDDFGRIGKINRHEINVKRIIRAASSGKFDTILVKAPSIRVEYYARYRKRIVRALSLSPMGTPLASDEILVHVRLNKMQKYNGTALSVHRDYPPLPLDFIHKLLGQHGLRPRFVGEFGTDPISEALRSLYPDASFQRSVDAIDDFRTIFGAKRVLLSPSTFSWLAAWLSPVADDIYMPLYGIFNPLQRPDINLMPHDSRYRYYHLPVNNWTASETDVFRTIHTIHELQQVNIDGM